MISNVTLEDLQGSYDITYASFPQLENLYEPGFGSANFLAVGEFVTVK